MENKDLRVPEIAGSFILSMNGTNLLKETLKQLLYKTQWICRT